MSYCFSTKKTNIMYVFDVLLMALVSLSFGILSSASSFADDSTISTALVTVGESCTLTGATDTAHTATLVGGTYSGTSYANGIGQTTLKVFCNDSGGFAIYAIGYTNEEYGNNKLHWDKAASASDNTNAISTGIYTSGTTVNSTWSMKLSAVSGTYAATIDDGVAAHNNSTENFTTWHAVPTEYKRVAYRLSGTDVEVSGSGTGSSITTTYDAYVSETQPAGAYVGKVKYTLVHPSTEGAPVIPLRPTDAPAYSIIYAPNASDIIGDMSSLGSVTASAIAGKQTKISGTSSTDITASTTEVELIAPNYARSGYGFAGWSEDFVADNSSTIYGPNETITIEADSLSPNGKILYPVWVASSGDMQEWTGCSGLTAATYNSTTGKVSAALNQLTALTDTRDGNVYTVARLADGKCWMVENLRLNNEHTTSSADIVKAQGYYTYPGTGTNYGDFIGLANSEDANFAESTIANSLYSNNGNTTVNIGSDEASYRIPRYNNNNTNVSINATNSVGTTLINSHNASNGFARWQGYGNYYNWPAAIASTNKYSTYSGANGSDAAGTSICPSGWELPLGYLSTGDITQGISDAANRVGGFSYLDRMMGGTGNAQSSTEGATQSIKWRTFPNNMVFSGNFNNSSAYSRGVNGAYWTRSAFYAQNHSHDAYRSTFSSEGVNPGSYISGKYFALTVRCVAQ